MQEKIKQQLDQLQQIKAKFQTQVTNQLDRASVEGKKILAQLGVDTNEKELSVIRALTQLRENNSSLREFLNKLDTATYDTRKKLSWDAHSMSAYARLKAEETYLLEVKPKLMEYRTTAESQIKALKAKAEAVKSRLVH